MKKTSIRKIAYVALLIAIEIVLSRLLSVSTPIVRIGFGFLPISIVAMLYGPLYAGVAAAIGDFLGATLFPIGAYFPGFTVTAFLAGAVYGIFLYNQEKTLPRICLAVLIVTVFLNLGLDTLWLQMITGKGILVLLPTRLLKCVVMAPVQIAVIRLAGVKLYTLAGMKVNS